MNTSLTKTCTHLQPVKFCKYLNCMDCGSILKSKGQCDVIKDDLFNTHADISTSQLYSVMLNDQYATRFYNPNAQYIKYRGNIINWLKEVITCLELGKDTLHTTISYMDYVLSRFNFPGMKFCLVGLGCLMVAAKYIELDIKIPPLPDFLRGSKSVLPGVTNVELKRCEKTLLKTMNWNLRIVTPLNFLELILTQGVLHVTDEVDNKRTDLAKELTRHSLELLDFSINSIIVIQL